MELLIASGGNKIAKNRTRQFMGLRKRSIKFDL